MPQPDDYQDSTLRVSADGSTAAGAQWLCPTCGLKVAISSNVCPQDGTPKAQPHLLPNSEKLGAHYEFISVVGSGGMSVIYKAKQPLMNKFVAIKMLHSHLLNDEMILRFQQEAKAAGSLKHPNVISVHDFGLSEHGQPYMVMDFVEGKTLSEVLIERGSLTLPEAVEIFLKVADALDHAHANGVLHRDLKPGNIMLIERADEWDVQIVDFGIAKIMDTAGGVAHQLTHTGELFGSPLYMSPEQCLGKPVDPRSDIYSLGCIIYEALVGKPPFKGETVIETIFKHLNEDPVPLHEARPDIRFPQAAEELVMKLLAKKPADRYQSMADVKQKLLSILHGALRGGEIKPKATEKTEPEWRKKITMPVAMLVIGGVLITLSLIVLAFDSIRMDAAQDGLRQEHEQIRSMKRIGPTREEVRLNQASSDLLLRSAASAQMNDAVLEHSLRAAPNITELNLINSAITDNALSSIGKLKHLERLDLSGTAITGEGLQELASSPELHVLTLNRTKITHHSIASLARIKSIKELRLQATPINDDDLLELSQLPLLWVLDLRDTHVTDEGLTNIRSMPRLEQLFLSGTSIGDRGLEIIKDMHLHCLTLSDTKVSGNGLKYIKDMKTLDYLGLIRAPMTPANLSFISDLPNLKSLQISYTGLKDDDLAYLAKLKNLDSLYIEGMDITDGAAKYVKQMSKLVRLNVSYTKVSDPFFEQIADTVKPEYIWANYCNVSDRTMFALAKMGKTKDVSLGGTHVGDAGVRALVNASDLRALHLWDCPKVTRQTVEWVRQKQPNLFLESLQD